MAKLPTVEILEEIGKLKEWTKATHDLAVKTNGRVTELEKQAIAHKAISEYKDTISGTKQWRLMFIATLLASVLAVVVSKAVH